jgi:hypothetical protein
MHAVTSFPSASAVRSLQRYADEAVKSTKLHMCVIICLVEALAQTGLKCVS